MREDGPTDRRTDEGMDRWTGLHIEMYLSLKSLFCTRSAQLVTATINYLTIWIGVRYRIYYLLVTKLMNMKGGTGYIT